MVPDGADNTLQVACRAVLGEPLQQLLLFQVVRVARRLQRASEHGHASALPDIVATYRSRGLVAPGPRPGVFSPEVAILRADSGAVYVSGQRAGVEGEALSVPAGQWLVRLTAEVGTTSIRWELILKIGSARDGSKV